MVFLPGTLTSFMKPAAANFIKLAGVLLVLCVALPARAQWTTQSVALSNGWSAVYLSVDANYDTIDNLVGHDPHNPIQEIWMWLGPASPSQFVSSPSSPLTPGTPWISWERSNVGITANPLNALLANQAFLVRTTNAFVWNIKGKAHAPAYNWSSAGLNLIGFPAVTNPVPNFDQYLSPASAFESAATILQYLGGNDAGSPQQIGPFPATSVIRGRAYWVQAPGVNGYFGPFSVTGASAGLSYGANAGQSSVTLVNNTSAALTVNLRLLPSASAPTNQPGVAVSPILLVRGALNTTNLTYGYQTLATNSPSIPITLQPTGQPGASMQVVLGLNRTAIADATPGDLIGGILRLTDNLGLSQIDLPVTASVASNQGLWAGQASITNVYQYLNTYYTATNLAQMLAILQANNIPITNTDSVEGIATARDGTNYHIDPNSSRILGLTATNGFYLSTSSTVTNSGVPVAFNFRLLLHNGTNQNHQNAQGVTLLPHVYIGNNAISNTIVTGNAANLDPNQIANARRISAIQFPWQPDGPNVGWFSSGAALGSQSSITLEVDLKYDDQASNPFLHTYHPDHSNMDPTFSTELPAGKQSYYILRNIRLFFNAPGSDFASLAAGSGQLQGVYAETMTLSDNPNRAAAFQIRNFDVQGAFVLKQIAAIPTIQ